MKIKQKKQIIGTIIIVIMLAIAGAFVYSEFFKTKKTNTPVAVSKVTDVVTKNGETVSYKFNNFMFEKKDGVWYTQIQRGNQPYIIAFTYGPIEVENISIAFLPNDFESLTTPGRKVYVSFDHDSPNASYIATAAINIINNLKTVWGVQSQRACLKNSTNCAGAPVINCDNTKDSVVIQFMDSDVTSVTYKDNCLTIASSNENYIKAAEKIVLNWYKIVS